MPQRKFEVVLKSEGPGSFIELPFDVKAEFGRAKPPVTVAINGYEYRSTVAVYGGKYFLPVRKEHRDAAGVAAGQTVSVVVKPDDEPRAVEPPKDLAAQLAKDAELKNAWKKLSFTHQREHVEALESAKRPETRARRLSKLLEALRGE
jgi:hypothetical protein